MAKKIDVVIPMYNRADFVGNIISELEKQTFKDFRAIFVDDGSKDNTCELLETQLADASFEYLIIKKENGGAGSARNAGFRAAQAEWIACVDSDDGLMPEFLEYLYTAVRDTNSDLGICHLKMIPEGEKKDLEPVGPLECKQITSAQAMKIYCTNWIGPVCFLIKREIQLRDNLYYDEDCIYNEDAAFLPDVIVAADTVAYIEQELYLYYLHGGSLHRSPRPDKFISAVNSFSQTEKRLMNSPKEAAKVFNSMGRVRFYIATLRRAAVQIGYRDFCNLERQINFKSYKNQIKNLTLSQKMACYALLISKPMFCALMKLLFKD